MSKSELHTPTSLQDAPKGLLQKSKTWRENSDEIEVCRRCKEWTSILEGCCEISAQGEDLWNDIAYELNEEKI